MSLAVEFTRFRGRVFFKWAHLVFHFERQRVLRSRCRRVLRPSLALVLIVAPGMRIGRRWTIVLNASDLHTPGACEPDVQGKIFSKEKFG